MTTQPRSRSDRQDKDGFIRRSRSRTRGGITDTAPPKAAGDQAGQALVIDGGLVVTG